MKRGWVALQSHKPRSLVNFRGPQDSGTHQNASPEPWQNSQLTSVIQQPTFILLQLFPPAHANSASEQQENSVPSLKYTAASCHTRACLGDREQGHSTRRWQPGAACSWNSTLSVPRRSWVDPERPASFCSWGSRSQRDGVRCRPGLTSLQSSATAKLCCSPS